MKKLHIPGGRDPTCSPLAETYSSLLPSHRSGQGRVEEQSWRLGMQSGVHTECKKLQNQPSGCPRGKKHLRAEGKDPNPVTRRLVYSPGEFSCIFLCLTVFCCSLNPLMVRNKAGATNFIWWKTPVSLLKSTLCICLCYAHTVYHVKSGLSVNSCL